MSRELLGNIKEKVIAVCIAGIDEYAQTDYMHAIAVLAEKYHCKLLYFTSFSSVCMAEKYFDGEMSIYTLINYQMLDAIILFAETIKSEEALQNIVVSAKTANVPIVTIDHAIEGCYNIVFDYHSAMEQLIRHVVEQHDFERIEFIGGIPNNYASDERLAIFKSVMEENGREVTPDIIHYGYFWAGPTEEIMNEMCARPREEMPDAIICSNDAMAIVVCRRLKEIGYQVPEDIAITGFDGLHEAKEHTPTLTTASLNYWAVMEKAYQIISELQAGRQIPMEYQIDFEVVYGESCGCKSDFAHRDSGELVQELYNKISNYHYFSNRMVGMTAALSDSQSLDDAMEKVQQYLEMHIAASSVWICVTDPFILDIKSLEAGISSANIGSNCFTDRIRCLLYKNGKKYETNRYFELKEILPDMNEILQEAPKLLILPLHVQEKLIGYIAISYEPWQNEYYQLQSFVNSLSTVLVRLKHQMEQKELMESLREKSMHDALTGILNRRGFFEELEQMYAKSQKEGLVLSVISLDMDGLKAINDTYGHAVGDIAIAEMAGMLKNACGTELICSRIGGDEFTAAGIVSAETLESFEGKMRKALEKSNNIPGKQYQMDFSIGIYSGKPEEGIEMDDFIRFADARMYDQKEYHHQLTGYTR